MNIGEASDLSGLPRKTIRYYEDIGLIRPGRSENGYRAFRTEDCQKLIFLAHARSLGFSVADCRELLSLYEDRTRPSQEVRRIAVAHLEALRRKLRLYESLRESLLELVRGRGRDRRPGPPTTADLHGARPLLRSKEV